MALFHLASRATAVVLFSMLVDMSSPTIFSEFRNVMGLFFKTLGVLDRFNVKGILVLLAPLGIVYKSDFINVHRLLLPSRAVLPDKPLEFVDSL